jgi:GNAT superfamily N-acetyltransferase
VSPDPLPSPSRAGRESLPEIVTYHPEMQGEVVAVWDAALGEAFPLREEVFIQNVVRNPHVDPAGFWVARVPGGPVAGVCLAKIAREPLGTDGFLPDRGWVSLLAVHPAFQRRGVGRRLLGRAEAYLRAQGRRLIELGGDPFHFFPGIPVSLGALAFFAASGYRLGDDTYDLRRSLSGYETPPVVQAAAAAHPDVEIRPLRTGEEPALLAFLDGAFPGRWRYIIGRFLAAGGRIEDIMGVVRHRAVLGFAHLFHAGSLWIGPSIAWAARNARAGGLGPMGLAPDCRRQGLGLALLDGAVRHLAALGMEDMVIDWTNLLAFYGRLGFSPWRHYRHGHKVLG